MNQPRVLLSTTSVFPEATASAFELAAKLGYDGVELMVGVDSVAANIDAVEKLSKYHGVQVFSVHAPVLIVSQNVWGHDPWGKLDRSAEAVQRLGGDVVVVHPPFMWQREYAAGFEAGIRRLNQTSGAKFCVENMYPWRAGGASLPGYAPAWNPTNLDYDYLTLDLSHASTARIKSMDLVKAWGDRLQHLHLTDGKGSFKDDHLLPGEGDQDAWEVVRELARRDYPGHIVLEVSTRRARTRHQRETMLADLLERTREVWEEGKAK